MLCMFRVHIYLVRCPYYAHDLTYNSLLIKNSVWLSSANNYYWAVILLLDRLAIITIPLKSRKYVKRSNSTIEHLTLKFDLRPFKTHPGGKNRRCVRGNLK